MSRTLVDCASLLAEDELVDVVDQALCRRLATKASVEAAARRGRARRGSRLLREVTSVWSPEIVPGSPAEVRTMRVLAELGVDGVVAQHVVLDDDGCFVARLDLAVPARRLGFEYDGRRFHGPRPWEHDEGRNARLRALGWTVETIDKLDLLPGEPRLRRLVECHGLVIVR